MIVLAPTGLYYVIIALTAYYGGAVIYDQTHTPTQAVGHILGFKEGTNGVN